MNNYYELLMYDNTVSFYIIITSTGNIFLTSGAENDVCKDTENEGHRNGVTEIKVLTYKINR